MNGTSTGAQARARCNTGFILKQKMLVYRYEHERFTITCHKFGYWENIPSCVLEDKEVDSECNPAADRCRDKHAMCTLVADSNTYRCRCNHGYTHVNGRCKAQGKYLPKADYDSDWVWMNKNGSLWHLVLEHDLDTVPILVDVQVKRENYVFHAIGSDQWYGYQHSWHGYGRVRARAWKLESLPTPDLLDDTVLRANTSNAGDSFYELEHNLGEYPGLVVVRAKMMNNGSSFYADGVGSALNVFYNKPDMTNAFLVYGFSNESVRTWIDSSIRGAIFDGRKLTNFDIVVSEATVEVYAWKISTLTPFFTYMFSLEDDRFPSYVELPMNYPLSEALNVAVAEVRGPSSLNQDFRFPSSSFLAYRSPYRDEDDDPTDCVFGGFTLAYEKVLSTLPFSGEGGLKMILYKPKKHNWPSYNTGALVCIPDSFGDGKYSEAVFNGIGVMYSWINGDCGPPPEVENGYINAAENGTEIGAVAVLVCNDGYRLSREWMPVCHWDMKWRIYTGCRPVECETIEAPVNGTMNITGLTFGSDVTFQCDVGYKLTGAEKIECLSTGKWSANTPYCRLKKKEDNETSRSIRGRGSVIGIFIALTLYSVVFIEKL